MTHEEYMREALVAADTAAANGNAPFGVVVTDEQGAIIWRDHDRVRELCDPTAHGEINAIRGLCQKYGATKLPGTTFYTTSEPCPTCLSAMIKARVFRCVYGAKTEPTASLPIPAEELAERASSHALELVSDVLAGECYKQREQYCG